MHRGAAEHYDRSYANRAPGAQRRWPNEEFCRFMGRTFLKVPPAQRSAIRILEAGCGTGSNLWMVAKEGFDAHGLDFSREGISLTESLLKEMGVHARVSFGDMTQMRYPDAYFDCVFDVLSATCLSDEAHNLFLDCVQRVLRPNGWFFTFTLGKGSTDWKGPGNVMRPGSPTVYHYENPLRYTTVDELTADLRRRQFTVNRAETMSRTYDQGTVVLEVVVLEARRN